MAINDQFILEFEKLNIPGRFKLIDNWDNAYSFMNARELAAVVAHLPYAYQQHDDRPTNMLHAYEHLPLSGKAGKVLFVKQVAVSTLVQGLANYYFLDEVSGDRADTIGSADLTDNNSVGFANRGPAGTVQESQDGEAAVIQNIGVGAVPPSGDFSIEGWWYLDSDANAAGPQTLVSYHQPAGAFIRRFDIVKPAFIGGVGFAAYGDDASSSTSFVNALNQAAGWHHYVGIYNAATKSATLYFDAVVAPNFTGPHTGTAVTDANTLLFAYNQSGSAHRIQAARLRFWNRQLTATEIGTLYNGGKGKLYSELDASELSGLMHAWDANETGTGFVDQAGTTNLIRASAAPVTNAPAELPGRVASFVAANSQMLINGPSTAFNLDGTTGTTFAGWFQHDGVINTVVLGTRLAGSFGWLFYPPQPLQMVLEAQNPASTGFNTFGASYIANKWHFAVFWFDPVDGRAHLALDGVEVTASAVVTGGPKAESMNFSFGGLSPGTSFSNMRASAWGKWDRVLTNIERAALWNGGNGLVHPFIL